MEMLISFVLVIAVAAAVTVMYKPKAEQKTAKIRLCRELADMDTLLQNVEAYDGTAKGQKKIGGGKR